MRNRSHLSLPSSRCLFSILPLTPASSFPPLAPARCSLASRATQAAAAAGSGLPSSAYQPGAAEEAAEEAVEDREDGEAGAAASSSTPGVSFKMLMKRGGRDDRTKEIVVRDGKGKEADGEGGKVEEGTRSCRQRAFVPRASHHSPCKILPSLPPLSCPTRRCPPLCRWLSV